MKKEYTDCETGINDEELLTEFGITAEKFLKLDFITINKVKKAFRR